MMIKLLHGDCLEQMKALSDNSVDSIVTDPPYGISFMAKKWDYDVPSAEVWKEALRVLKPGGHALIACGTRTQHRMAVNIEDAGFEIRDVVSWIYGSGFPKSLNISKAIDKAAGAERPDAIKGGHMGAAGRSHGLDSINEQSLKIEKTIPAIIGKGALMSGTPVTPKAKQWDGWGTALKPACEFFTLCRKPLSEKTVAANVLKWGTGGINIDRCRVAPTNDVSGWSKTGSKEGENTAMSGKNYARDAKPDNPQGRFPANLIHDGSQQVFELLPETKSRAGKKQTPKKGTNAFGDFEGADKIVGHTDQGSAARFFYCPKASKKDRGEGNNHPTVKPTALMQYLCRLITPTGGVVLDPYMGSGSTGRAAVKEGFGFVGCELDGDYFKISKTRILDELY